MPNQQITTLKTLPHSTGECDIGPEISFRPGHVSIRYDTEGALGIVWTELRFTDAVALRVTPDIAVAEELISAYSRVCEIEPSTWLEELQRGKSPEELRSSTAHGGWPEHLRHYAVYFDHFGAVEVLALDFAVSILAE